MGDERITRQCRRCGGWPRHASCTCLEGPLFDPPTDPAGAARNEPRCRGVARMADNDRAILLSFDRPISDDELRALHDSLRHRLPAPPASEAGHREDSDEGLVKALGSAGYRDGDRGQFAPSDAYMRAQERLLARLRQLRAEGELYRRMLDQSNATLDAEGRRVGIEMGCDTAHWMAEEILGLRADGERLRASDHRLAGVLLGEVQRAREEAAREQRERDATLCHVGAEECTRTAATMFAEGRREASRAFRNKADALRDMAERIRSQPPGAAQPQEGV